MPVMKYFWPNTYMITMGMVAMTPAAISRWYSLPCWPCRVAMATESTRILSVLVAMRGHSRSFQHHSTFSTVMATMALLHRGSSMFQYSRNQEQPSMRPASSSSPGREAKNCRSMNMVYTLNTLGTTSPAC